MPIGAAQYRGETETIMTLLRTPDIGQRGTEIRQLKDFITLRWWLHGHVSVRLWLTIVLNGSLLGSLPFACRSLDVPFGLLVVEKPVYFSPKSARESSGTGG